MLSPLDSLEPTENPGYHLKSIPKGKVGELSKIYEELLEAYEAESQDSALMVLIELSDLIGAIDRYLQNHHPSFQLDDLIKMSSITQRAFDSGRRA